MSEDKKISVKEFRHWLEGVEEMQPEDWIPDARQWKRIREKFNEIDDTPSAAPAQAVVNNAVQPNNNIPLRYEGGGIMNTGGGMTRPPMPVPLPPSMSGNENMAIKTPDIAGPYGSQFA